MAKYQSPVLSNERARRFIWEFGQVTIIRNGDDKSPKSDTEPDKPAPGDDEAPSAASALVPEDATDDPEQTDKP